MDAIKAGSKGGRRSQTEKPTEHSARPTGVSPEEFLAAIVASSDNPIIGIDLDGHVTSWNPGAERVFGYTQEEILGEPVERIIPPELLQQERAILDRVRHGHRVEHFETQRLTKDGRHVHVSLTISPIRDKQGRLIGASKIHQDISQRKQFEIGAARLRLVIEAAPNGMVMVDEQGQMMMVNSQMERLFGYDRSEMLGQRIEMLLPSRFRREHSDLLNTFLLSPQALAMGLGRDLFGRRKDGSEFPVEVGLNPADTPEGKVVLASVIDISQRKAMEQELAKAHAELENYARNLEATVDQRTADLQETIAELESFSYSLSHDMRAPLRTIQSFSQVLREDAGAKLTPAELDLLNRMSVAASRLDRLIQDVLAYSSVSRTSLRLTKVDLEPLLQQLIEERPEFQPPKAQIEIERPLPKVLGHEAYLTQCITNLLDNAIKFVPPGAVPRVRIRAEPGCSAHRVRIWFEDNGIGIPEEAQKRVFGIFERVHNQQTYPGTGIGLAIVRKAVQRMGGEAGVESEPGQGSRFWLDLHDGQ